MMCKTSWRSLQYGREQNGISIELELEWITSIHRLNVDTVHSRYLVRHFFKMLTIGAGVRCQVSFVKVSHVLPAFCEL